MKLFAGLLALMLLIGGASFWAWRAAQADLFEVRCGDSVSNRVALGQIRKVAMTAWMPPAVDLRLSTASSTR